MTVWENLQRSGVDHYTSPCDPRKILLIKATKEWRYCLNIHPDFFKMREMKKYFDKLFKNIIGIPKETTISV
jgi:hypothetical protein